MPLDINGRPLNWVKSRSSSKQSIGLQIFPLRSNRLKSIWRGFSRSLISPLVNINNNFEYTFPKTSMNSSKPGLTSNEHQSQSQAYAGIFDSWNQVSPGSLQYSSLINLAKWLPYQLVPARERPCQVSHAFAIIHLIMFLCSIIHHIHIQVQCQSSHLKDWQQFRLFKPREY